MRWKRVALLLLLGLAPLLLIGLLLLAAHPTLIASWAINTHFVPSTKHLAIGSICSIGVLVLPLLVGRWAVRVGARWLEGHGV